MAYPMPEKKKVQRERGARGARASETGGPRPLVDSIPAFKETDIYVYMLHV